MPDFMIQYPSYATLINEDERKDLIPDYISTMDELNQLEQSNIADAFLWIRPKSFEELLTASFVFKLHGKMFGQVWNWAGTMRKSNKNIGVLKEHIMNELGNLLDNTKYWILHKTFSTDEIAVRFHHRLVQIHVFPNGNGRHARLMTDLLLQSCGSSSFTWGPGGISDQLQNEGAARSQYIHALKSADKGDFEALLSFVRS